MIKKVIVLLLIISLLTSFQPKKIYARGNLIGGIVCLSFGIWGLNEESKTNYIKWSAGYLLAVGTFNILTIKF